MANDLTPSQRFSGLVRGIAERRLSDLASTPSGRAAIQRVALAFISAAKNAKKPDALYNCDSESIGSCMIQSAETGLFPGGPAPAVWLVPKAGQLHWWLSHRGVLTLAERAGYVVSAKPWFQADQFSYEAGTEERISHVPDLAAERTWDTLRGVYVIVRGKDDGIVRGIHVMTRTEIAQRRSKALDDNIWNSWPIEMAIKTAIKGAAARGVLLLDAAGQSAMDADAEYLEIVAAQQSPAAAPAPRVLPAPTIDPLEAVFSEPTAEEKARIAAEEREEAGRAK